MLYTFQLSCLRATRICYQNDFILSKKKAHFLPFFRLENRVSRWVSGIFLPEYGWSQDPCLLGYTTI